MVYCDPITCLKPEGRATLIKKLQYSCEQNGLERWLVEFDSDGARVERLVCKKTT